MSANTDELLPLGFRMSGLKKLSDDQIKKLSTDDAKEMVMDLHPFGVVGIGEQDEMFTARVAAMSETEVKQMLMDARQLAHDRAGLLADSASSD